MKKIDEPFRNYVIYVFIFLVKHASIFSNTIEAIYLQNGQNDVSVLPLAGDFTSVKLAAHTT